MLRSTHLSFWGLVGSLGPLGPACRCRRPSMRRASSDHRLQEPTIATVDGDMKPARTSDVIGCGPTLSFITG